jgi:hypothetical protein
MTLEQWLKQATGEFPVGVQARLAQEYRTHLDESVAAGGVSDPVVVFGAPGAVRSKLARTYLTRKEFDARAGGGEGVFWLTSGFVFVIFGTHLMPLVLGIHSISEALSGVLAYGLIVLAWAVFWLVTQRWPQPRRSAVRTVAALPALMLLQVPSLFSRQPWELLLSLLLLGFALYTLAWQLPRDDLRLRRTLALEQPV